MTADVNLDMRVHETLFGWEPSLTAETIPRYSTDQDANGLVRTWLEEHNWHVGDVTPGQGEGGLFVRLTIVKLLLGRPADTIEAVGETAKEALCRAAQP